jgi:hypothetical protein
MLLSIIRRFTTGFTTGFTACFTAPLADQSENFTAPSRPTTATAPATLSFDPVWHGDHWQNLLSSPMDARHYVMEDWSIAPGLEPAPVVRRRA